MKYCGRISACRVCRGKNLANILSFGSMPPANKFLKKGELMQKEPRFPLDVMLCRACSLVQLRDVVSPALLFKNYVYVSSTAPSFIAHFQSFASQIWNRFQLTRRSLVVDIGSNDGILLKPFKALGAVVMGVDPARSIAKEATAKGIKTIPEFFTPTLAQRIWKTHGYASVITGTNVFAHINDLDNVLRGIVTLLDDDGVFIIEVPYLVNFLQKNFFDTVYHEHLSYFSITPLVVLCKRFDMEVYDVEHVPVHGGSVRVFMKKEMSSRPVTSAVEAFLRKERVLRLSTTAPYRTFANRIEKNKKDLLKILHALKKDGKRIVGYGAPGKGNTLLNYFDITTAILDAVADDSPLKQGLYTPGTHIPVVSPEECFRVMPDYVLILAWNFADDIMKKLLWFKKQGGRFIIPVPHPRII